jgi:hypothetical protein
MKKTIGFVFVLLAATGLASCGTASTSSVKADASSVSVAPVATLTADYSSPAQLSYVNMRPTYNYYLTTFTFEELETYSDNTYILTVSSSCFSGVILPEEGNAAQGNERTNYLTKYYGTFTKETDSLDDDTLYITSSLPTRIVSAYDSSYFVDTDNWTDTMKTKSADKTYSYNSQTQTQEVTGTKEYATGKEYLDAKKFTTPVKFTASIKNCSIEFAALTFAA